MVIFQYNLCIFGIHLWTVLYPKPCYIQNRVITNRVIKRLKCTYIITKTRLFKYIENFTTKKLANFQIKNSNIFHISAQKHRLWVLIRTSSQNIDCGYSLELPLWGSSNEYPQSMFLSRNKKNNVYPCKPQFYYTKMGFKGVKII